MRDRAFDTIEINSDLISRGPIDGSEVERTVSINSCWGVFLSFPPSRHRDASLDAGVGYQGIPRPLQFLSCFSWHTPLSKGCPRVLSVPLDVLPSSFGGARHGVVDPSGRGPAQARASGLCKSKGFDNPSRFCSSFFLPLSGSSFFGNSLPVDPGLSCCTFHYLIFPLQRISPLFCHPLPPIRLYSYTPPFS